MRISALSSPTAFERRSAAQAVAAYQLGHGVQMLGRGLLAGLHLIKVHGHAAPGDLPGGFAPGESPADNLYAHQSSSSSGLGTDVL